MQRFQLIPSFPAAGLPTAHFLERFPKAPSPLLWEGHGPRLAVRRELLWAWFGPGVE